MSSALIWIAPTVLLTVVLGALVIGLRFVRRGLARFHLALPFLCVTLLPTALGVTLAARTVRETMRGMLLTGSGGLAACSAGAAEAQIALAAGLVSSSLLGLLALLVVAAGSSRSPNPEVRARVPLISLLLTLCAAGLVAALAVAGIAASVLLVTNGVPLYHSLPTIQLVLGLLVLCVLPLLILHGALQAPRERPRPVTVVLGLVLPLLTVGVAATLAAGSIYTMNCLMHVAITGSAAECPLTSGLSSAAPQPVGDEEGPGDAEPEEPALPIPPPPPPPPPSPEPTADGTQASAGEMRRDGADEVEQGLPSGRPVLEPKKLKHVPPVYPPIARQARVQGTVILEATLAPSGRVRDVRVLRGIPLLDAAAVDAVRQWEYAPTLVDGVPAAASITVTVHFRID